MFSQLRKNRPTLGVLGLFALLAATEFIVIDHFYLNVEVRDAATGKGIPGATVLATFRGDEMRIPFPDVPVQSAVCITSLIGKTDQAGVLKLNSWERQKMLVNKTATLTIVSPRRIIQSASLPISVGTVRVADRKVVQLHQLTDNDQNQPISAAYRSLSQGMTLEHFCGTKSWAYGLEVLDQLRELSVSEEERRRTLGFCKYLKTTVWETLKAAFSDSPPPLPSCHSLFPADPKD